MNPAIPPVAVRDHATGERSARAHDTLTLDVPADFLAAGGIKVGKSLYEPDHLDTARQVIRMANDAGAVILLPQDLVVAKEFKAGAAHRTVPASAIADDEMALDVGPDSIKAFENRLLATRTLVWNGPFGALETAPFDKGTVVAKQTLKFFLKGAALQQLTGGTGANAVVMPTDYTITLVPSVHVLAVSNPPADTTGKPTSGNSTFVLDLTPSDATNVIFAVGHSTLYMGLLPPDNEKGYPEPGVIGAPAARVIGVSHG